MKKDICKKGNHFCIHFVGDTFNKEQINKCYRYCSCSEATKLMGKEDLFKCEDSMLKKRVRRKYSIMIMT